MNAAEVFFGTATEIYRPKSSAQTSGLDSRAGMAARPAVLA